MFTVNVDNENDRKYATFLEHALNKEFYPKLLGAATIYGEKLIQYLVETNQHELLFNAMNGMLEEGNILMDEETYKRIYG